MNVALKEWSIVIDALAAGRQIFLLRKGGIAEGKRGFELLHRRFLLFPTWEHQHGEALQPAWRERFLTLEPPDPSILELRHFAEVYDIAPAPPDPGPFLDNPATHVWTAAFFERRYAYRPDLPLFVVAALVFELPAPVRIPHDRRYQGCRSWVNLYEDISIDGARAVVPEAAFERAWKDFQAKILG